MREDGLEQVVRQLVPLRHRAHVVHRQVPLALLASGWLGGEGGGGGHEKEDGQDGAQSSLTLLPHGSPIASAHQSHTYIHTKEGTTALPHTIINHPHAALHHHHRLLSSAS